MGFRGVFLRHGERNHQGLENGIIEPEFTLPSEGSVECRERLGGLLRYYLPRGRVIQGDLNFRTLRSTLEV